MVRHCLNLNNVKLMMKYTLTALLSLCLVTGCNTVAGIGEDISTLGGGMRGFADASRQTTTEAYRMDAVEHQQRAQQRQAIVRAYTAAPAATAVEAEEVQVVAEEVEVSTVQNDAYSPSRDGGQNFRFNIREFD